MLFLFQCVSVMKNDVASDADADADGKIADYSGSILTIRWWLPIDKVHHHV